MATLKEVLSLGSNLPVQLLDGHFGLVIRFDEGRNEVGVQVAGEENMRWLNVENLKDIGGALIETEKAEGVQE